MASLKMAVGKSEPTELTWQTLQKALGINSTRYFLEKMVMGVAEVIS